MNRETFKALDKIVTTMCAVLAVAVVVLALLALCRAIGFVGQGPCLIWCK